MVRTRIALPAVFCFTILLGITISANAATQMWLTDLTTVEKSELLVAPGGDFDVMVHLNTDLESLMLGVAVAYDRADETGLGATPTDHKISLKNDDVSSFVWTANMAAYSLEMPTLKGGLQYKGSGDYVYGVSGVKSVLSGKVGPFTSANSHICTVHFSNSLTAGQSYYLKLWDGPNPANGFTSFIQKTDESYLQENMAYSLKVTAVPEPGSLACLLAGLVAVGSLRFRRRV